MRLLGSMHRKFYCKLIDQCTYNYMDSTPQRPIWTTGSLARTTWEDSSVFGLPHATYFNAV